MSAVTLHNNDKYRLDIETSLGTHHRIENNTDNTWTGKLISKCVIPWYKPHLGTKQKMKYLITVVLCAFLNTRLRWEAADFSQYCEKITSCD